MRFKPLTAEEYAQKKYAESLISIDLSSRPLNQVNLSQSPHTIWSRQLPQTNRLTKENTSTNQESPGLKK